MVQPSESQNIVTTLSQRNGYLKSRFQLVSDIYCRGGQVGPASQISSKSVNVNHAYHAYICRFSIDKNCSVAVVYLLRAASSARNCLCAVAQNKRLEKKLTVS